MLEVSGNVVGKLRFKWKYGFREKIKLLLKRAGYPTNYTIIIRPDDNETDREDIVPLGSNSVSGDTDIICVGM